MNVLNSIHRSYNWCFHLKGLALSLETDERTNTSNQHHKVSTNRQISMTMSIWHISIVQLFFLIEVRWINYLFAEISLDYVIGLVWLSLHQERSFLKDKKITSNSFKRLPEIFARYTVVCDVWLIKFYVVHLYTVCFGGNVNNIHGLHLTGKQCCDLCFLIF